MRASSSLTLHTGEPIVVSMKAWVAILVACLTLVGSRSQTVSACGDKFVVVGRGVRFEQAYAGAPVDNVQYGEARRQLMQQIAQRQQEMAEEQKKQQAAGQTGAAPAAAPPKAAAPAPAKK